MATYVPDHVLANFKAEILGLEVSLSNATEYKHKLLEDAVDHIQAVVYFILNFYL